MTDLLTHLPKVEESNFRFQNQKALLTYKTHLDKNALGGMLSMLSDKTKAIYIAHENGVGDSITPYEHTHVVIDFGKRIDKKDARFLDFNGIHPHISKITNIASWKKACKYICKEDKTVILKEEDEFSEGFDIQSVWGHNTLEDALTNMSSLRDALPTIALYNMKKQTWGREIDCPIKSVEDMYKWQAQIHGTIMTYPGYREVVWICDEEGCKGKTQFIKYCAIQYPGKVMWIEPSGTTRDIIHVIMEQIKAGWRGDTIMINLPRSATTSSDMAHVYRVIETLKDGMIYSSKYSGGTMLIPSCHVLVMSNTLPDYNRLSRDRWCVYKIHELELAPVTLSIRAREEFSPMAN